MEEEKSELVGSLLGGARTGYTGIGFVLEIRAAGNWTRALNSFAYNQRQRLRQNPQVRCKYLLLRSKDLEDGLHLYSGRRDR